MTAGRPTASLALAGDTMLGRGVAETLITDPAAPLVSDEVAAQIAEADAFVLNLECCISDRGTRFADPTKPFFFRAPPIAAERLAQIGADAVTLANNHALDYGFDALFDTLRHLEAAGVATVGAGVNEELARAPLALSCGGVAIRLIALSDHPRAYAAARQQPGIAFADLSAALPGWVPDALQKGSPEEFVLVTPHWGPNMVAQPIPAVRRAAQALLDAGATLIAGHSAHVFHGVAPSVLFDLGDFLDDYAVDPTLRNDLGLLWLLELEATAVRRVRAMPLALDYCYSRVASPHETDWILRRLRELCRPLGSQVDLSDGMLEIGW